MPSVFWKRLAAYNPFAAPPNPEPPGPTLEEVRVAMVEEFRGVRKLLGKQSLADEELRDRPETPRLRTGNAAEGLMQLAAAFFHLDLSLRDQTINSPPRREAVSLFWLQLEQLLNQADVQIIREQGVPFDARLHRVMAALEPGARRSVVTEILEPGFIEGGKVRKPAKVIVGSAALEPETLHEDTP